MRTEMYKNTISLQLPIQLSLSDYLNLFNKFPKEERMEIANKISETTFADRWLWLKKRLPSTKISEQEVMDEVKKLRKARYEKN